MGLALIIGAGAGAGAVEFRYLLDELAAHRGSVLPVRASLDGPLLGRLGEHDVLAYLRAKGQR